MPFENSFPGVIFEADPEAPGWFTWQPPGGEHFSLVFAPVRIRPGEPGHATVRITPGKHLTSITGALHGGAIAGFLDVAIFAGAFGGGAQMPRGGATVDLTVNYFAPAFHDRILDAEVEVLRETGRMVFVRGTLVQGGETVVGFSAILRKKFVSQT